MSQPESIRRHTDAQTLLFITLLSVFCAVVLSVMASALAEPQEDARVLYRSKQMLIAAKLLDSVHGCFLLPGDKEGVYVPAKMNADGYLEKGAFADAATNSEILSLYRRRIVPMLIDKENKLVTFEKAGIDLQAYLEKNRKTGYYRGDYRLIYEVMPEKVEKDKEADPVAYVIPVNGFGLWDAIYGFLALEPDGDTVIGITWYDQKETPGLGANIADFSWQEQFAGKKIFQPNPDGKTNFSSAPIGINVVRGKVSEVIGSVPKAESAVDGMAGATLTGNGVTQAYHDVLVAYREFLVDLNKNNSKESNKGGGAQ
ncbi:MAG: NADH:ubiquinone reductase (Na(+)-transporting) subunit C [Chlamydiia bacterium]|nr:NADH:ubiquinone reductase (Na(+)-transporting) subunit C [Chlamydiia bacterium]